MAVRWYLRYGLSYRDLEELLVERGVEVDHVTLFRWVCCVGGGPECGEAPVMRRRRSCPPVGHDRSAFSGFRFPPEVIVLAVRRALLR